MAGDDDRCCFDDWARSRLVRARRRTTLDRVTEALVTALDEAGLRGRTVLDVGCGVGDLALAAVAHGAAGATGVDLGPGAVASARVLAAERGLSDRSRFAVADGSVDPLERHDVVALNRVICCYPDLEGLIRNTTGAASGVYAFVVPRSSGLAGALNRLLVAIGNSWFRLNGRHYRGYRGWVHDVDEIDRHVTRSGLRRVRQMSVQYVWHVAVYARDGN